MGSDRTDNQALGFPGEWVATANGQVIAHGPDFARVAQEACGKARDIAFEQVPDPGAPLWRPARIAPRAAPRERAGGRAGNGSLPIPNPRPLTACRGALLKE